MSNKAWWDADHPPRHYALALLQMQGEPDRQKKFVETHVPEHLRDLVRTTIGRRLLWEVRSNEQGNAKEGDSKARQELPRPWRRHREVPRVIFCPYHMHWARRRGWDYTPWTKLGGLMTVWPSKIKLSEGCYMTKGQQSWRMTDDEYHGRLRGD